MFTLLLEKARKMNVAGIGAACRAESLTSLGLSLAVKVGAISIVLLISIEAKKQLKIIATHPY